MLRRGEESAQELLDQLKVALVIEEGRRFEEIIWTDHGAYALLSGLVDVLNRDPELRRILRKLQV